MDDALLGRQIVEVLDLELGDIGPQHIELQSRRFVENCDAPAAIIYAGSRRDVVIRHGKSQIRAPDFAAGTPQAVERLRACDLVNQMPVDVDETGAVFPARNNVRVPDLFMQRARTTCHSSL